MQLKEFKRKRGQLQRRSPGTWLAFPGVSFLRYGIEAVSGIESPHDKQQAFGWLLSIITILLSLVVILGLMDR